MADLAVKHRVEMGDQNKQDASSISETAMNLENRRRVPKYGFGMSPISALMQGRYSLAVEAMLDYLGPQPSDAIDPELISELKGMFNRCIRQDQWDWFSVYAQLGEPPRSDCVSIVSYLATLRRSVSSRDRTAIDSAIVKLRGTRIGTYLEDFRNRGPYRETNGISGWIYILSTREQPQLLKIGKTTRSIFERVKEINRATGVLFPFSARAVFRVPDAAIAEKEVFALLRNYRVRPDREFFEMDFRLAVRMIEGSMAMGDAPPET